MDGTPGRRSALVQAGLLERRWYNEHPPRDEYVLTKTGSAFLPVVATLGGQGQQAPSAGGAE
ncbi:winged helix-turn-helix transcriptional regulator [Streptomyces sp. NPDC007189]|uniref:winged helix-turn-helix transcriptional regulator n=1 Tax=Streptomyces sp. NPDC007189 TaxID=3154315 RepID=UPI0034563B20